MRCDDARMSNFVCPRCAAASLVIHGVMELGPDDDSDERSLQQIACAACSFTGCALYEESRRGAGDAWRHTAHDAAAAVTALAQALTACLAPRDHSCSCAAHDAIRAAVTDHAFLGPALPMHLAR